MSLLSLWKSSLSRVKSERTLITYTHAIEYFLKSTGISEEQLIDIDPGLIYKYMDESELSVSSILTHLCAIKHFYKFALKRRYISKELYTEIENTIDDIREEISSNVPHRAPKALTKDAIKKVLKHVQDSKYEKVYTLLFSTGLRLSEYLSTKADNFYVDKSSILWIRLPADVTKRKKERLSPVIGYDRENTHRVTEKLLKWIENYEENFQVNRGTLQVFTYRLSHKIGVPFSVHSFRHTYITNLVNNGFSAEVVKEFAGHANIRTTLDIYYRFSVERARRIVENFLK